MRRLLHITVTEEQYEALRNRAHEERCSVAALVRKACFPKMLKGTSTGRLSSAKLKPELEPVSDDSPIRAGRLQR